MPHGHQLRTTKCRHWAVTCTALPVLLFSAYNLSRGVRLYAAGDLMARFSTSVVFPYMTILAILWGSVWLVAAAGLWRQYSWARKLSLAGILIYEAHNWIFRWMFDVSDYARQGWPMAAVISFVSILVIWTILCWPGVPQQFATNSLRGVRYSHDS